MPGGSIAQIGKFIAQFQRPGRLDRMRKVEASKEAVIADQATIIPHVHIRRKQSLVAVVAMTVVAMMLRRAGRRRWRTHADIA